MARTRRNKKTKDKICSYCSTSVGSRGFSEHQKECRKREEKKSREQRFISKITAQNLAQKHRESLAFCQRLLSHTQSCSETTSLDVLTGLGDLVAPVPATEQQADWDMEVDGTDTCMFHACNG